MVAHCAWFLGGAWWGGLVNCWFCSVVGEIFNISARLAGGGGASLHNDVFFFIVGFCTLILLLVRRAKRPQAVLYSYVTSMFMALGV